MMADLPRQATVLKKERDCRDSSGNDGHTLEERSAGRREKFDELVFDGSAPSRSEWKSSVVRQSKPENTTRLSGRKTVTFDGERDVAHRGSCYPENTVTGAELRSSYACMYTCVLQSRRTPRVHRCSPRMCSRSLVPHESIAARCRNPKHSAGTPVPLRARRLTPSLPPLAQLLLQPAWMSEEKRNQRKKETCLLVNTFLWNPCLYTAVRGRYMFVDAASLCGHGVLRVRVWKVPYNDKDSHCRQSKPQFRLSSLSGASPVSVTAAAAPCYTADLRVIAKTKLRAKLIYRVSGYTASRPTLKLHALARVSRMSLFGPVDLSAWSRRTCKLSLR